ncbi:MAG: hypothetical protein MI924_01635 [Chloroflexales bacterium]|nr:hypothetical protein [Chloroflexales bacterium]
MTAQAEHQLIAELSRRVVADVAPEERRAFQAISEAYFKNPEKTLKGDGGDDQLLGWGVAEISLLLTPIILEVVKEVLKDLLTDSLKDSLKKNSATLFEKLHMFIKRLFGSKSSQSDQPPPTQLSLNEGRPLSQEQLKQARHRARESAIQLGVDPDKATLIADSVIVSLQIPVMNVDVHNR